ncbi:hypothetical protein [Oscillatoria acuminata]|uniref:DUF3021 domain-containing protein n=1 Tax=Oscillatoria acuminata PCC 6304 TaxID=56110 RepID=K9TD80_9CYAN|nr:hypothetical protein [Oscillatoria acuminata]AFY80495.1 hypothetical protein Oscil6304_0758 [Oscillatoria acuminata PCC 6304]
MKETVGSLRAYFGLIGVLSVLSTLGELYFYLSFQPGNLFGILLTLIGLGLSCLFLYFSFDLKKLLIKSPEFVSRVILVSAGFQIISLVFSLLWDNGVASIVKPGIGILICWYLLANINRLSRSLQEEMAQKPNENKTDN